MPISKIKISSITADASSVNLNIDANTLFLDAANNRVGVGTTSPSKSLHVSSSSNTLVRVEDTTGSVNSYFGNYGGIGYVGMGSNHALGLYTNDLKRVHIDTSGNLGLGVTPSAWTTATAFQMNALALYNVSANYGYLGHNVYVGSLGNTYKNTGLAFAQEIGQQGFKWYTAVSGTADTAINTTGNFTQAMVLDTTGNLGINVTSPSTKLDINSATKGGITLRGNYSYSEDNYNMRLINNGTTYGYLSQVPAAGGIIVADGMRYYGGGPWTPDGTTASSIQQVGGNIIFTSNGGLTGGSNFTPAERVRIDSSGNMTISSYSTTASGQYGSPVTLLLKNTAGNSNVGGTILFGADSNSGAAAYGASIWYSNESSNSTGSAGRLSFGTKGSASETAVSERIRISTYGVVTKFDADTNSYIRDHGIFSVGGSYLHIKFNLTKNSEKMLGWRLYGYKAYDTFIDTYYGTYLYSANSTPYGSIVRDAASPSGGAIYYGSDGYLVISCATNASQYTGLRLESIVNGGSYGGAVDVQVTAYKAHSASTGAY